MQIIHTSPVEIKEINSNGRFGDCLFFADDEYAMGSVKAVYAIEIDEENIIDGDCLEIDGVAEQAAIEELIRIADGVIDSEDAFALLSENVGAYKLLASKMDGDQIAEIAWDVQRLQGRIAAEEGCEAFRGRDEQGTVYIVPMAGKLERLERVR